MGWLTRNKTIAGIAQYRLIENLFTNYAIRVSLRFMMLVISSGLNYPMPQVMNFAEVHSGIVKIIIFYVSMNIVKNLSMLRVFRRN